MQLLTAEKRPTRNTNGKMNQPNHPHFPLAILKLCLLVALTVPHTINAQSDKRGTVPCLTITVDANTDNEVLYAAQQLQYFMRRGGLDLPIETSNKRRHKNGTIHIGRLNLNPENSYRMIGDGNRFLLAGSGHKGTLYAVYDFLERFCGYRMYSPEAIVTPDISGLRIPTANVLESPAFAYREVSYYYPNHSQLYADWHRINTLRDRYSDWGLFVHTFKNLVPAERHFDQHPEWFSMRDGKRVRDGQLCLSNPQVLETLCLALSDAIADDTLNRKYWSVSPNDNYNVCQCSECLRQDALYGGPTGTLLHFVNQVARRFPDKYISTLAYQYTRSAPKDFKERPDSNVVIMLCPIEAGREEAISTSLSEASFRQDFDNWHQLTDKIFMWDYVVQFRNFWNPFPNLHVLPSNLRYFHSHGAKLMYEQATGANNKTSWMEPRGYLIAKLMWNPFLDADSLLNDFCNGYYGSAGSYIKAIIDTMTNAVVYHNQRLDIYGYPIDGCETYLTPKRMALYRDLMEKAYAATTDSAVTHRLRYFELSLDFATVELASSGYLYDLFPYNGRHEAVDAMKKMLDRMVDDLNHYGVEQMMEMGISPNEYRDMISRYLEKTFSYGEAYTKKVELRNKPDEPYTCMGAQTLTNGVGGIMDYRDEWLGFFGDTIDATITLGDKPVEIGNISMDFYFYPLSWIFLPEQIDYYISDDKRKWRLVGRHLPDNPEVLATPAIKTFSTDLPPYTKARYVRVVATPMPQIPDWHRATGNPAWLFTDEIVVLKKSQTMANIVPNKAVNGHTTPPFLFIGDTVALISPSYYCDTAKVNEAASLLSHWGLVPLVGPNVGASNSKYAGTDRQRLDDLLWAYKRPGIKAIICNRGGYGTLHFVNNIDPQLFVDNPKWMVGYSDITTLHTLSAAAGGMSIHGIMASGIADCKGEGPSTELLHDMLFGTLPCYHTPPHPCNISGKAKGTLIGGNFFTYEPIAGTPHDAASNEEFILFVEEIQEDFHHIDRLFNALAKRGVMKNCRGVILGDFTDCAAELGYLSVEQMLHQYLKEYNIPVLCGFHAGHGTTNLPLIIGAPVSLEVTPHGGTITFDINTHQQNINTTEAVE